MTGPFGWNLAAQNLVAEMFNTYQRAMAPNLLSTKCEVTSFQTLQVPPAIAFNSVLEATGNQQERPALPFCVLSVVTTAQVIPQSSCFRHPAASYCCTVKALWSTYMKMAYPSYSFIEFWKSVRTELNSSDSPSSTMPSAYPDELSQVLQVSNVDSMPR